MCILTTAVLKVVLVFNQIDCFDAPFVSLHLVLSVCSFPPSPSPPTRCSLTSAGDLIGRIDCKWNRGVWVNRSNIVKQFFRHEGISLASVELIRAHSPSRCLGFQGQGPRPLWLHREPNTHPLACSIGFECPTTLLSFCYGAQSKWWISKLNADLSIHGYSRSKFHSLDLSQASSQTVSLCAL